MVILDMYTEGVITKTESIYMVEPIFLVRNFAAYISPYYPDVMEQVADMEDLQRAI
jgi:hypothetical protein